MFLKTHTALILLALIYSSHYSYGQNRTSDRSIAQAKKSKTTKRRKQTTRKSVTKAGKLVITGRSARVLKVIDEELNTLNTRFRRLVQTEPPMMFRVSELYFEKAKILQEEESRLFLKVPLKKRQNIKREVFFAESRKNFIKAQNQGLKTLERTKEPSIVSEIFIILAYNAKEFNDDKQAKAYFYKALQMSPKGTPVHRKAQVALAEYHYNDREYETAVKLYEEALVFKKYRWWTKDAFNFAWCYYQLQRPDKAVKIMEEAFFKSKQEFYIDISERALQNIGLFFATSKKINEAIAFYRRAKEDISTNMVEMAKILMTKEMLATAEEVLKVGYKFSKTITMKKEVQLMRLRVYEKFGRVTRHFNVSKQMFAIHKKSPFIGDQKTEYIEQMLTMAAMLQKQVAGETYRDANNVRTSKAVLAANYFKMLSVVDFDKTLDHRFFEGETWYAVYNYSQALTVYTSALNYCYKIKRKCKKDKYDRIINGVLATLAQDKLNNKLKAKYLIPSYELVLKIEPVSDRSQKIYIKLFNSYLSLRHMTKAEGIIKRYTQLYSKDLNTQEAMVARILEGYQKQNNIGALSSWAERIHKKEFRVSAKYAKGLYDKLAQMKMLEIQKLIDSNDKKTALDGYRKLYAYHLTPLEFKKTTAYNIFSLYFELGWMGETVLWVNHTLRLQSDKEVAKYIDTYMALITDLFYRQYFVDSAKISQGLLTRFCQKDIKFKKAFYVNSAKMLFADSKYDDAYDSLRKFRNCTSIDDEDNLSVKKEFLSYHIFYNQWSQVEKLVKELEVKKEYLSSLIPVVEKLYLRAKSKNLLSARKYQAWMNNLIQKAENAGHDVGSYVANDRAAKAYPSLQRTIKNLRNIKLTFPEETFNARLQQKLGMLENFTTQATEIIQIGSEKYSGQVYLRLIEEYEIFAAEIERFTPPNQPPEYVKGFKESMRSLSNPLKSRAKDFRSKVDKLISSSELLSRSNLEVNAKDRTKIPVAFKVDDLPVLMDRNPR